MNECSRLAFCEVGWRARNGYLQAAREASRADEGLPPANRQRTETFATVEKSDGSEPGSDQPADSFVQSAAEQPSQARPGLSKEQLLAIGPILFDAVPAKERQLVEYKPSSKVLHLITLLQGASSCATWKLGVRSFPSGERFS